MKIYIHKNFDKHKKNFKGGDKEKKKIKKKIDFKNLNSQYNEPQYEGEIPIASEGKFIRNSGDQKFGLQEYNPSLGITYKPHQAHHFPSDVDYQLQMFHIQKMNSLLSQKNLEIFGKISHSNLEQFLYRKGLDLPVVEERHIPANLRLNSGENNQIVEDYSEIQHQNSYDRITKWE